MLDDAVSSPTYETTRIGDQPGAVTQEEWVAEFPDLIAEDIRACLAFAVDWERTLAKQT